MSDLRAANAIKMVDLFSGIGGFSLAARRAGIDTAQFCEINPFCQQVLAKNFPGVPIHDDITTFDESVYNGRVDLITGGFPCQDVSVAGNRAGLAGARSGLFFEFARILELFQPRWFVVENVPGLLTSNDGRDFAAVLSRLEDCGYGVAWRTVDAQYAGVACTRRRVFLIGSFGTDAAGRLLFDEFGECELLPDTKLRASAKPMCVGWDGGLSFERLRQCVLTETDAPRARARDGLSRQLDKPRYRALGNAVVPQAVYPLLRAIKHWDETEI